jgi:hypothetical protein
MKKQIDLPENVVKALTHEAVENGTDFKNYVQTILTKKAHKSRFYVKEGGEK